MAKKFIVTGDIHFRSEPPRNRKDNYESTLLGKMVEVFDLAMEYDASAIIIPGDIFDSSNVGLGTISKFGRFLNEKKDECCVDILAIPGNHDLPAGNMASLPRTPFGLLEALNVIENVQTVFWGNKFEVFVSGCGFDYQTDTSEGKWQYHSPVNETYPGTNYPDTPIIHVVHSMLLPAAPSFPMRHTLIDEVETDADIIISGHYHEGFGVIRRKDGKLFINPGALCRLSASESEMKRTVQVALLTVRSKTDFDAELIPLQSARPAEEVLDREAVIDKKEHENWLESFFESLNQEGEAKFLEVQEIIDSIASRERISPLVKDEALRRISEAREKLGRVAV